VPDTPEEPDGAPPAAVRVQAASLLCDSCGRTTPHRILRWDRRPTGSPGRLSGVARCQVCRWTHPFVQTPPPESEVALVVSAGSESVASRLRVPSLRKLQVGSNLPGSAEPLRIRRIESRSGESLPAALPADVGTVWATHEGERAVPVSIVERARTHAARWITTPTVEVEVGVSLTVDGATTVVVGIRARGRTWRYPGARFPASDVQRLYVRRAMPPAGSRDWSRVRVRPSSRARATSSAPRSRSGPGTRTTRTVPRAATADGGADVQSNSPA
jgi:uncharacterized Zn finger protein